MLIICFLIISAAITLIMCAGPLLSWQSLLVFIGVYLLVNIIYIFAAFFTSFLVDTEKPVEKEIPICRFAAVSVFGLLCDYLGLRVSVEGEELLPTSGEKYLIVCNHRSGFDPVVMMRELRRHKVSFIAKPSIMALPFIGKVAYGIGCLAIDRENDRNALKTILTAANYLKKGVCNMSIFPEGTRSRSGDLLPFHAGSFKIAQRAGAPLVIAAMDGTENITKNALRRRTRVTLRILEVIPADKVKAANTQELAEYSRRLIGESLGLEVAE